MRGGSITLRYIDLAGINRLTEKGTPFMQGVPFSYVVVGARDHFGVGYFRDTPKINRKGGFSVGGTYASERSESRTVSGRVPFRLVSDNLCSARKKPHRGFFGCLATNDVALWANDVGSAE